MVFWIYERTVQCARRAPLSWIDYLFTRILYKLKWDIKSEIFLSRILVNNFPFQISDMVLVYKGIVLQLPWVIGSELFRESSCHHSFSFFHSSTTLCILYGIIKHSHCSNWTGSISYCRIRVTWILMSKSVVKEFFLSVTPCEGFNCLGTWKM